MSVLAGDTLHSSASAIKQRNADVQLSSRTLELSESRTYDRALETLGAYKLTGNFPIELEIVLRDMRALGKVTFEIKPKLRWSDRRQVEFRPKAEIRNDHFDDILRHIKNELGGIEQKPFWTRLLG
jgi:hypothetical protein